MKTKALISFAVTAKLICVFVFLYAKCWFSHDAAHIVTIDLLFRQCQMLCIFFYHVKTHESLGHSFLFHAQSFVKNWC